VQYKIKKATENAEAASSKQQKLCEQQGFTPFFKELSPSLTVSPGFNFLKPILGYKKGVIRWTVTDEKPAGTLCKKPFQTRCNKGRRVISSRVTGPQPSMSALWDHEICFTSPLQNGLRLLFPMPEHVFLSLF